MKSWNKIVGLMWDYMNYIDTSDMNNPNREI